MATAYVPARRPEDWRPLLASPERHWRVGRSAYELAHSWQLAEGFPRRVARVLDRSGMGSLHRPELLVALPERGVSLPGGGAQSKIDLFALAHNEAGALVALGVEAKESEPFGKPVEDWLAAGGTGRAERLAYLAEVLEVDRRDLAEIEYQLLHRTVATILEAQRFGAACAVMLVHSFTGDEHVGLDAFQAFAQLLGAEVGPDRIARVGERGAVELVLAWVADSPRPQTHDGEPEAVLREALEGLRATYHEQRLFKERDVEAQLQQRMSELFEERRSRWRVYENFRIHGKLLDLAVVDPGEPDRVPLGVEVKYEPAHTRGDRDLPARKFPVVIWSEVVADIEKLRGAVENGHLETGFALLVDEGGYWRAQKDPPPFASWEHWDIPKGGLDPAVLVTTVRR